MALTPEYLQKCSDEIDQIFWKLGTRILMDIADRIRHAGGMTSTTEYLNEKLRVLGLQQTAINEMLAEALNTEKTAVDKLMEESTAKSTRQMFDNLEAAGYDTSGLEFRDQILKSTNVLNNELTNLTRTTAQLGSTKMMDALDQAYLQVSSGAYSFDEAVANACQKLAREGLDKVEYPTGAHRTVEAAVRVAVRTSVNQNALQCEMDAIKKMGINLVETSSHLGARPTHAVWQGKVFWLNTEDPRYENFYEATGYGTATGLGGYNCRHSFYPYFEELGEQTYEHFDEEKNREHYEQEQKQRYLERKVREWDRREQILKAGGQDTTEATRWKKYYKDQLNSLVKSSNGFLKRDYAAEKAWSNPRQSVIDKSKMISEAPRRLAHREDISDYDLTKLNPHQDKHRPGTAEYNAAIWSSGHTSIITISNDTILELVQKYAQTGRNIYSRRGLWTKKEVIIANTLLVGYYDNDGELEPTTCFMICYSKKKGVHIRPVKPYQKA